jgi:outer membrane protein assembly factor BamB
MEEVYGASPVVVNGVVYTSEENNYVYALNATDGTQLWDYFTGEWPSSPAVANGVVYVNTDFSINALNATDGTQIWSNEPQYDVPVGFSSPTVADGVVYAGTTNSLDKSEGNVYAMNATNGKTLWSTPSLAAGFATVPSSPTVANGVVYIGDEGAFGWSIPPNTPITQICYGVYALNATSGAQLWNYNIGYSSGASPVVVGGVVYYVPEEDNLFALNSSSGAEIWNYSAPMGNLYNVNVDSSPAVVDGIVYLGSDEGNIYAFNAASGAILWNCTTGNGTLSTPTFADGVMYIGSSDDNIYALNATNGVELWSYPTSGAVNSPTVVNGVLYVGESNNIYALRVSLALPSSIKTSNTLQIIIGAVVFAVIIVASVLVLVFKKKLKTGDKNGHA